MKPVFLKNAKQSLKVAAWGILLGSGIGGGIYFKAILDRVDRNDLQRQILALSYRGNILEDACEADRDKITGGNSTGAREVFREMYIYGATRRHDYCVIERAKVSMCRNNLRSTFGEDRFFNSEIKKITNQERIRILQLDGCEFRDITLLGEIKKQSWEILAVIAVSGIIGYVSVWVLSFYSLWLLAYPHVGWRRFVIVLSPIIGFAAGWWYEIREDLQSAAFVGVTVTLVVPVLVFTARRIIIWVKAGFDQN